MPAPYLSPPPGSGCAPARIARGVADVRRWCVPAAALCRQTRRLPPGRPRCRADRGRAVLAASSSSCTIALHGAAGATRVEARPRHGACRGARRPADRAPHRELTQRSRQASPKSGSIGGHERSLRFAPDQYRWPYSVAVSARPAVAVICSLGVSITLLPGAAGAQQPAPTFSVSVTEPFELVEEVGTTRRLTRADIEARNARTLDEALRLLPGVYVRTGGDDTPRIDVRGFRSRHVLAERTRGAVRRATWRDRIAVAGEKAGLGVHDMRRLRFPGWWSRRP